MAPQELPSDENIDSLSLQQRIDSARGYKAALHNPRVSKEKKEEATSMLEKLDEEGARQEMYRQQEKPKSPSRVATGLRAALRNPLVGEEGRRGVEERLEELERGGSDED
ncbi:Con-6 family protein [Aspergillus stella-maris]|uniref:Con-6 family protein n=1 Tax=Aspergillus stella-maris TaxID=1810926 RepID=UPI003CCD02F7